MILVKHELRQNGYVSSIDLFIMTWVYRHDEYTCDSYLSNTCVLEASEKKWRKEKMNTMVQKSHKSAVTGKKRQIVKIMTILSLPFLSFYPSICLSVRLSIYITIYLYICVSVYLSVCLSIYLSFRLSVCLSIYLSIYLSS